MSKIFLLIMPLCAALCSMSSYAQHSYPMTLEELYRIADERSRAIRVEEAAVEEAEADLREVRAGRLPDINLSLSASYLGDGCLTDRDFGGGQHIPMPHFGNNFVVEATQLIYGGGAVTQAIALSRLKSEMAGVNLAATRSRVRLMLTGFFLEMCKLKNLLLVYDHNIALAQEVIDDTKERIRQGIALQNDLTRYELQLKNVELARTRTEYALNILNYDLVTMLDLEPGTTLEPDRAFLDEVLPTSLPEELQREADNASFALQRSALQVQMSERAERMARADRLPKVSLIAANHFDGPITIEVPVINKNFNYWFVGVGLSFPLSSLYKAGRSVKRAELTTALNRRRLEEAREEVHRAVYADFLHYREAYDEVETLEKQVELACQNYEVIKTRYDHDIVLVTDMLDAASRRLEAELELANARIQTHFLYRKLQHTIGKL